MRFLPIPLHFHGQPAGLVFEVTCAAALGWPILASFGGLGGQVLEGGQGLHSLFGGREGQDPQVPEFGTVKLVIEHKN
jgi:hypothetical protein